MASAIDHAVMRERLDQSDYHVSLAERQMVRLHEIIAELGRDGHDVQPAMNMLHQFEQTLASYIANRDRLREELGD
jgi:hypothetical protein